ncbi:MAG: hypothetical protein HY814_11875 [Candidatus Riflebacteria bacterium]|nr:hypothetical protein [Candidatus Riflebacteria bacterium]
MSTVLAMRFNQHEAILIADESTWHLGPTFGYRRTNFGDHLASLIDPEESKKSGLSAVYAGTGFPSFHHEVARRARAALAHASGANGAPERWDNRGLARVVHEAFVATHERMIDDKLRFNYGFGRDALNSRSYVVDGRKLEVGQDGLIDSARSIAAGSARGNAYVRIFTNSGFLVTHDGVRGIQGWHIDAKGCHLGFATPISVLGEGDEVSTHLVARFVQRRDLVQRRRGFSLRDGLYIAMSIATELRSTVGKIGGYFQISFVDGEKGTRELVSDAAHLATEVMRAHLWGFLQRKDAEELIAALVLDGAEAAALDKELFARATEPQKLLSYLIGFKPTHAPAALEVDPPTAVETPRREAKPPVNLANAAAAAQATPESRERTRPKSAARGNVAVREGGDRK